MTRPNILMICTDQQRFDSLGCYGNAHVISPNIDRLAEEGVLFENCYAQNPVCSPSRASFFTGLYPHSHGLWANGVTLPGNPEFFTRALADGGYDTGMIGKMHLSACFGGRTEPRHEDGFRCFEWAHDPSHASDENAYHQWLRENHPEAWEAVKASAQTEDQVTHEAVGFDEMTTETHYTRWVSERTVDFLKTERPSDQPFFLLANFFDPHHPFVAPKEYLDLYDPSSLPRPIEDDLADKPAVQRQASEKSYAGHAKGFTEYTPDEVQQAIAGFYAMVTFIDDEVGRILPALDEQGLRENTLIVFTSDHGEMLGDHGLMLKGPMLYEAAVRVPLIMSWSGQLPRGERRSDLVEWFTLGSTFLEAAGLPPLVRSQAPSILPLAREAGAASRPWAVCEYRDSGHPYDPPVHLTMLRVGRFKLIAQHGDPATARSRTGELYDLESDPNELVNLWDDPGHISTRLELQEQLLDILVASEDRNQPREADW